MTARVTTWPSVVRRQSMAPGSPNGDFTASFDEIPALYSAGVLHGGELWIEPGEASWNPFHQHRVLNDDDMALQELIGLSSRLFFGQRAAMFVQICSEISPSALRRRVGGGKQRLRFRSFGPGTPNGPLYGATRIP